MAKTIRFPLEMKDGVQVRTMGELKANWDVEKIVAHFLDGKLATWLRDRHFENEVLQVEALGKNDAELRQKLSTIFDMEFKANESMTEDMELMLERQDRLNRLRQYTNDKEILDNIDHVAFETNEIFDVLDTGAETIYLVNGKFEIPLQVKNKHYVGIGKTIAVIDSKEHVDFETLGIRFENIKFDEKYEIVHNPKDYFIVKGEEACKAENYRDAIGFYEKAAEVGDDEAMTQIGIIYLRKLGSPYDAFKWLNKAAKLRNAKAMYYLGTLYIQGAGVELDKKKAIQLWLKAADAGNEIAMQLLSYCYKNGDGVEKNEQKAIEWLYKAANGGHVGAMNELGNMYHDGCGIEQNKEKAVEWFHKAAEGGNEVAMYNMAFCYENGEGVERNTQKAIEWFRKAANAGNADAMNKLGELYFNGAGIKQDKRKAVELWTKAVDTTGYTDAKYHLGYAYLFGEGVEKDEETGLELIHAAAEAENINAMKVLGDYYRPIDNKTAREWCKKAALLDDCEAAYKLAVLSLENQSWNRAEQQAQYEYWKKRAKLLGYKAGNDTNSDNVQKIDWYKNPNFLAEFLFSLQTSTIPFDKNASRGFLSLYSCKFSYGNPIKSDHAFFHDIPEYEENKNILAVLEDRHPFSCGGIAFTEKAIYVHHLSSNGHVFLPYAFIKKIQCLGQTLEIATNDGKSCDIYCDVWNPQTIKIFLSIAAGINDFTSTDIEILNNIRVMELGDKTVGEMINR